MGVCMRRGRVGQGKQLGEKAQDNPLSMGPIRPSDERGTLCCSELDRILYTGSKCMEHVYSYRIADDNTVTGHPYHTVI